MAAQSGSFSIAVEIGAPPGEVWAVMRDVERWNLWTPSIKRIKRLDTGPFGAGSRALVFQPRLLPAVWRVTVFEADRGFTWVSGGPGIRVTGLHRIEPSPHGCRVTLSVTYEGVMARLVVRMLGTITERYIGWEAEGLKRKCEGSSPA